MGKTRKVGKIKKILLESEYDNSRAWENMQDIKKYTYAMKCFILIGCLIIFISSFSGLMTIVGGAPVDYNYTFENDYLYDDVLPESIGQFNVRNKTAGHYPATYSFTNEAVGTSGNNIVGAHDFSTTDTNGQAVIIADDDGHKKVLKLYGNGDNGALTSIYLGDETEVSGTLEWGVKYVDYGRGIDYTYIYGDSTTLVYIRYECTANRIVFYYGNGVGGSSNITVNGIVSDVWYHIKIYMDCITDKYSAWVNGALKIDDLNFYNDRDDDIIRTIRFQIYDGAGANALEMHVDALGFSWDKSDTGVNETYFIESVNMVYGTKSGIITAARIDDGNFFILESEWVVAAEAYYVQTEDLGFTSDPHGRNASFSYYIWSSSPNVKINVNNVDWKTGTPHLDSDNQFHAGVDDVYIWAGSASEFTLRVYYFKLISTIFIYNYEIGDNRWISEMVPTNELEVDKYEFVCNSTGDFYEIGTNDIEGWNITETTYGKIELEADDSGFDNVVNFYLTGYGGHSEMNKTLETYDNTDYMEISINGSIEGRSLSSGTHEFFINCTDIDGLTVFSLKFMIDNVYTIILFYNTSAEYVTRYHGTYTPIGINHELYSGSTDFDFNINLLFYNDSIFVDYNDEVSCLYTGEFEISNTTEFLIEGKILKYIQFINDWSRYSYVRSAKVKIDNVGIYINGESISTEVYPENVFILSDRYISSNEYTFLEITFNYEFIDNNLSIYINDDVHIINYNEFYIINGYRNNLYLDGPFNGFYLRIYNSSAYDIINIKLYGIKLTDELTGEEYYLEFDYENVNIQESYFHVDSSNRLQYSLTTNDTNLEYMSANFDITNVATMNRSISFSHRKSSGFAFSEFRVLYADTSYSSFFSIISIDAVNSILPQNKVIEGFYFLITDNDNDLNSTLTGYFSSMRLIYYPNIETTIGTLSLMGIIPLLILLVVIPFLMYMKFKNAIVVVPTFILMTIIGITTGLLPGWVGAVLIMGSIFTYLIKREVME